MNVRATLVSNEQAAKTMKPGDGALDALALASDALAALDQPYVMPNPHAWAHWRRLRALRRRDFRSAPRPRGVGSRRPLVHLAARDDGGTVPKRARRTAQPIGEFGAKWPDLAPRSMCKTL